MQSNPDQIKQNTSFGRRIAWFGAGFVLPFYSPEFYLYAIKKPLRGALLFFATLMTVVAGLSTVRVNQTIDTLRTEVLQVFQEGTLTSVTIADGVASVEGEDPFLVNDGDLFFFAIDTQGALDHDSFNKYRSGILITQTLQYSYANGNAQSLDLSNYNLGTGADPLVIDEELVGQLFGSVSVVYTILAGVAIWFWDVLVWLLFLAASAYFLWGPIHQTLPEFSFRSMLIIGLYAHLPAYTINHIINLFGVQTFFIYTTLLLVFWIGALYMVLKETAADILNAREDDTPKVKPPAEPAQPPRLWPAWLGLPALVFIAANAVSDWEFGPQWALGSLAVTIAILLTIDYLQHPESKEKIETKPE